MESGSASSTVPSGAVPQLAVWQRPLPALAFLSVVLALGLSAGWGLFGGAAEPPLTPKRFAVTLPESDRFGGSSGELTWPVALSPDGTTLVYRAVRDGTVQLLLRPLDQLEAVPIPGTRGALAPFFAPNGEWVGFAVPGGSLRTVALSGGPPQTLMEEPGFQMAGADWGEDDMIVYGVDRLGGSLMQIPAGGGEPTPLFTPEDRRHPSHPQILPGGNAVLFTMSEGRGGTRELHVLWRESGEQRQLLLDAAAGRFLDTGHLVFVRSLALWGVGFDLERMEVVGTPEPLVVGVGAARSGGFALADDGTLGYRPVGPRLIDKRLVWIDHSGTEHLAATPPGDYVGPRLSPDGRYAAITLIDETGNEDVWISELDRGTLTRITRDDGIDGQPLWHPDGRRVVFTSNRNGRPELFSQATDGTGAAERVLTVDEAINIVASDWSPDGATLFVEVTSPETNRDVGMLSIDGSGTWEPLIQTSADEADPVLSPDGRWLAYSSNETGRIEVYARRFPELDNQTSISLSRAFEPAWSPNGRDLFYLRAPVGAPDALMRVPITIEGSAGSGLNVGTPELLFDWTYQSRFGDAHRYDVAPDGPQILAVSGQSNPTETQQIHVVLNWTHELKERVPTP